MCQSACPPSRFRRRSRPGFALVAVLLMLLLITLVALGMLSLSTISLRQSGHSAEMATARANARLALSLALGNLQKTLGPDGRVSASSSLLDANAATDPIEGVQQRHWTGVWTASRPNANGGTETPWSRDDADGGLRDARATGGWPRTDTLAWLVSTPPGTTLDPRTAQRDDKWVRVAATGNSDDDVWTPTIEISGPGNGRCGWWIGDEGIKAKINLPDAWAGKIPAPADAANGGYYHWLASQKNEPQVVDPAFAVEEKKKPRILTTGTLTLGSSAAPEKVRARFHDFTTTSLGLPVNVSACRLKRDLTAYLTGNGAIANLTDGGRIVSPGLTDDDRLEGPANAEASAREGVEWASSRHQKSSPRFGLLRKWAQAGSNYAMQAPASEMIEPRSETSPLLASGDDAYDSTNEKPAAIGELDTPSISPVLVEGSMFYSLATFQSTTVAPVTWKLRTYLYPRVVLWNPYNLPLKVPASSLMLHVNGGKRVEVTLVDTTKTSASLSFASNGALTGALYFGLDAVTLEPGACAVFSPTQHTAYTTGNPAPNRLSASSAPSPGRAFTVDLSTTLTQQPKEFREAPSAGAYQAQDYRMLWKRDSAGSLAVFNSLKQLAFVSCTLQYGDDTELPVEWTSSNPVPLRTVPSAATPLTDTPDVRTRDGFRLRWFNEHPSNKLGSGSLANTNHFDIAPLANWNPRASYSLRTPYENVTDVAPQFFGAYTRDLFDAAVSWDETMPVPRDGIQQTWPFGQPIESPGPLVLFDVPRKETGILSLAQFQHAKVSEFVWHPSYAIGNSLPDPRLEDRTDRSAPFPRSSGELAMNGWTKTLLGYAAGRTGGSQGNEQWAFYARWLVGNLPSTDAVVNDLSFELNRSLWDDFFLSTGTAAQKQSFASTGSPLPNGRMRLLDGSGNPTRVKTDLTDFHRAASHLGIDGAFNINSTSVAAWKAVLAGTRGTGESGSATLFPRLLNAPGPDWKEGTPADGRAAWSGTRVLEDAELDRLATAIVVEVKRRGPFLSLADFVNRRLDRGETGKAGVLEAAIQAAALNKPFNETYPLLRDAIKDYTHPDNIADATRIDPRLMPESKAWGAPAYLTQADILQPLGPQITARSDTFLIRSYGDSRNSNGTVTARAWCEAVVQRLPDPVTPDGTGLNPVNPGSSTDYGRRFAIVGFRWLTPEEV